MIIYIPVGSLFPLMVNVHFKGTAYHASIVEVAFAIGMFVGGIALSIIGNKLKKNFSISLSIFVIGIALVVSGVLPS